ncbi:uncharacterized protein P174DRAFT_386263 [Aspergillus novofumigatus IBT 16806]|uniref:Uncharacterized protein n=1 Tax=Aspergillus novofumigatus (strain IBT 16806) TaxID=1392255 RepID=A0A2I1CBP3_ASPN1|nr:uncharacterized protein P174DRAFT_386263 [Aspergillus novofumigatus IBT 16806]PKX95055.1 hypothetical protein P174DRAFT_386263 [Aspergillus novofumigatus IBT 16806]
METSHPIPDTHECDKYLTVNHTLSPKLAEEFPADGMTPVSDRLARLAFLSENARLSEEQNIILSSCLDSIESIFDPRPGLTQEIAQCRPKSVCTECAKVITPDVPSTRHDITDVGISSTKKASIRALTSVLCEITELSEEFKKRRKESLQIYGLCNREIRRMTRSISVLEHDVHELRKELWEETAEREGLQGTVNGLVGWVEAWQEQHAQVTASRSHKTGRRQWTRRKMEKCNEETIGALLEGIRAWTRGWRDVEEAYRIRERERRLRMEGRQRQQLEDIQEHSTSGTL